MELPDTDRPHRQAISLLLAGLVATLCILPVFLVKIPAMNDYPNHLARMYLLTSLGTADQNPYYYFYLPYVYPNLAMDIVVPFLGKLMNVALAMKVFLILSQVLVVSGAIALEMVVKRRHELAGFVGSAVLYSLPFAWGFLNFEFGVGLALWGLAAWFALESKEAATRLVVHAAFCVCLFVSHLVAFGLYGVTLAFFELWRAFQPNRDWRANAKTFAILVGPAAIILGYFTAFAIGNVGKTMSNWYALGKLLSILHGMNGYSVYLSLVDIFAIAGTTIFMFKKRYFAIARPGMWISVGLLIVILSLPFRVLGGDHPSLRIAIGALLILPAFVRCTLTSRPAIFIPSIVLSLIAFVNAGHIASLWLAYQPQYTSLQTSFRQIKSGAFVLVAHANFKDDRFDALEMPVMTATALAAHYSNAFVPTLFAIPGQQPLQVCPELKRFELGSTDDYWPVAFSVLSAIASGTAAADVPAAPAYVEDWIRDYDYLYLVGPRGPNPMPSRLIMIMGGEGYTLYGIKKSPGEINALESLSRRPKKALNANGACQLPSPTRPIADSITPAHKNESDLLMKVRL